MKTRDKVKYAFATILALMTCAAILAMVVAERRRESVPVEERQRIRQTLQTFGQLPPGMTPVSVPSPTPAPTKTPLSVPPPVAAQHGATQVDPATRP